MRTQTRSPRGVCLEALGFETFRRQQLPALSPCRYDKSNYTQKKQHVLFKVTCLRSVACGA